MHSAGATGDRPAVALTFQLISAARKASRARWLSGERPMVMRTQLSKGVNARATPAAVEEDEVALAAVCGRRCSSSQRCHSASSAS